MPNPLIPLIVAGSAARKANKTATKKSAKRTVGKKPSPRTVSASYRGKSQPRRKPVKTASGLGKAMKATQRGRKPWN